MMKIIMFNDGSDSGMEKSSALYEVRQVFEDRSYKVDMVHLSDGLSDDAIRRAADMMDEEDLIVFGRYGRAVMEKILTASSHTGLKEWNDALLKSNDTLTRDNAALQGRNNSLQASNDSLQAHNDSLQESNDTLTRDNAALQGRNDSLQASNDSLQASNDSLQASNDTLTRDNAALQGRNDSLQASNDSLQASNDTLTRDNAALQGRNDSLQASNDSLQASNDTLTRDNAALQGRNDSLQASNDSLQASNDTLTRDNAALQGRNDSLQASNDSLQASNDTLTRDNAALQGRNDSLQASNDSLARDNAELQADNLALLNDSREDSLTKVLNRRGYDQDSQKFIQKNSSFILISVDINDFKLFNDIYGHKVGDQVLIALADEFRALLPEGDLIARSGGDEFQLMVARPNAAFMQAASDFFNGVHSLEYDGQKYTYSLSAGFAAWPEQTQVFEKLSKMADSALYHAKMLSKEKFWKYEPDMDNDLRASLGFNARNLAENAPGAMIICKVEGDGEILFANPMCAWMFGYGSVSEFTGTVKYFLPQIDPEDRDTTGAYLAEMTEDPEDMTRWDRCISYRIRKKDGTFRKIKTVGRMVINEHFGKVFYAFLFDCGVAGEV